MQITKILKNKKLLNELTKSYELVIGLEIHAQLNSKVKLFSDTNVNKNFLTPNTSVSDFDVSIPGTLPILQQDPLSKAIKAALALNCRVNRESTFDRKHYFYYDLPQGYQITQQYHPLAVDGLISFDKDLDDNIFRDFIVNISRIQLEQDTGKAFTQKSKMNDYDTLVDLNRCNMALIEIVTKPNMRTPLEAVAFIKKLRSILRSINVCNGNMEEGSLRADVNVNVKSLHDPQLKTSRVEIKNLNSLKSMSAAISYEFERHAIALKEGTKIEKETRGWLTSSNETYKLRAKEDLTDYRYMPDPNLKPIRVEDSTIENIKSDIGLLPDQIRLRLLQQYNLSPRDVNVLLTVNEDLKDEKDDIIRYFEYLANEIEPQIAINWTIHELLGHLTQRNIKFNEDVIPVERMKEFLSLIKSNQVTVTAAKKVLNEMFEDKDTTPSTILDKLDLRMFDENKLNDICDEAINQLPDESRKAKEGNQKVLRRIIGQCMKLTNGKADGKKVEQTLKHKLEI